METYTEILAQEDMEKLLSTIAGFHDSMTKEVHLINRGYVQPDHSMSMNHKFDVQCLIQSQWEPYAMELVFCNVSEMHLTDPGEYWSAWGEVRSVVRTVEQTEIEMSFAGKFKIKASRLFYKSQPEQLGQKSFLRQEVPTPEAVSATLLEDNWRQCSNCQDAWEVPNEETFSFCPCCGLMTEINKVDKKTKHQQGLRPARKTCGSKP